MSKASLQNFEAVTREQRDLIREAQQELLRLEIKAAHLPFADKKLEAQIAAQKLHIARLQAQAKG